MRQTIFLLAFCLSALLLAACGRFDVAIVEPSPVPGEQAGAVGAVSTPNRSGRERSPTPTPAVEVDATVALATDTPTEVVEDLATPVATEETLADQPDPINDTVGNQGDRSEPTVAVCTVRVDWPLYAVKSGDTLFRIASRAGATVDDLVHANCLADPDRLFSGQRLRVPKLPADPPGPPPTPTPEPWRRYTASLYQVAFDYPTAWKDVSDGLITRLAGDDGWVQLAAASAPADLDTAARDQAFHKLQPYGSAPTVDSFTLSDGRPARLILPSADQPASMNGQSLIVAPYAEPILIASNPHNYLMLTADGAHIREIGATLVLPPPSADIFIDSFTVSGEDLPTGGKRVTYRWSARGANRGIISSGTAQRFAPWWPVESAGQLIVDLSGTIYPDPVMTLRVVNDVTGQEATARAVLSWACEHDYFFQPSPAICPRDAALVVQGAYQPFERGFMIWLHRPDLAQPSIYVFTDDGRVSLYPDTWSDGDPANTLDETPPEGLFEPVGGFAKVWREHSAVRDDLGWGTANEWLYTVTHQAEARESIPGVTYITRPDGSMVRLLDTIWQEYVPGQDAPGAGGGVTP